MNLLLRCVVMNVMLGAANRQDAVVRWLLLLSASVLVLGVTSIFTLQFGMLKANTCLAESMQSSDATRYTALGKWSDAPKAMPLNWYVCEKPPNVTECAKGWIPHAAGCYQVICDWKSFDGAEAGCVQRGAHLAKIDSEEENKFVQSLCGWESCWIGLSQDPQSNEWLWPDATSIGRAPGFIGFTNWNKPGPTSGRGRAAFMNHWGRLDMPEPMVKQEGSTSRKVELVKVQNYDETVSFTRVTNYECCKICCVQTCFCSQLLLCSNLLCSSLRGMGSSKSVAVFWFWMGSCSAEKFRFGRLARVIHDSKPVARTTHKAARRTSARVASLSNPFSVSTAVARRPNPFPQL